MFAEKNKSELKLIVQPRISLRNYLFEYYAHITDKKGRDNLSEGGGVSVDKKLAKMKAIGEAIERYCGSHIYKPLIKKSFQEIRNKALDPRRIIYFHKNQYKKDFLYRSFHPSIPINWVKGYSLTQRKSILIPAFAVYMGYNRLIKEEPVFTVTTSNGLAAGKSLKEATIRAIFELIERDALMITWYTKKRIPRLEIKSSNLAELKNLHTKITEERYLVEICVTTIDMPIPSVIAVIYDPQQKIPFASFGAAADWDIEKAAFKSLEEAILVREVLEILNNQKKLIKINSLFSVNTFLDHAVFYAHPCYRKAWSFLLKGPVYSLSKIKKVYNFTNSHRVSSLKRLIKFFKKKKIEIIRVDLTNKEIKNTGFRVVRMLIPELQPIDVNYKARFLGSKRLAKFINKLGQINKYPHPLG